LPTFRKLITILVAVSALIPTVFGFQIFTFPESNFLFYSNSVNRMVMNLLCLLGSNGYQRACA